MKAKTVMIWLNRVTLHKAYFVIAPQTFVKKVSMKKKKIVFIIIGSSRSYSLTKVGANSNWTNGYDDDVQLDQFSVKMQIGIFVVKFNV